MGLTGRNAAAQRRGGVIPTCVGLTGSIFQEFCSGRSYPHVRGAYVLTSTQIRPGSELSPRAWGVRTAHEWTEWGRGAIPTCVRLTSRTLLIVSAGWSYPHVRGAYWGTEPSEHSARESSPRAWGLHTRRASATVFARVIPTCVGLTVSALDAPHCIRSYPHVCGAYPCPPAVMLAGGVFLIRLFTVEFSSTAFLSTYHLPGRVSRSPQP